MSYIKNPESYRYGRCAYSDGVPYDPERCCWAVWSQFRGMRETQCSRKPVTDRMCKQHAAMKKGRE